MAMEDFIVPSLPEASTSAAPTTSISVSLGPTSLSQDTLTINLTVGGTCLACNSNAAAVTPLDLSLLADTIIQKLQQQRSVASPKEVVSPPTNAAEGKKKVRTKTGCITCRTRRTKCDEAKSPSSSRRKSMVSPLDGYVQLGCSIALVPPQSRTIAATGLLNAILALGAGHLSYLRKDAPQDEQQWSRSLRSSVVGAISVLEDGNGGCLTAGSTGLGSEVELVLASVGIIMYRDCITADPDFVRPLASASAAIRHNGGPSMLLLMSQGHLYGSELDYRKLLVYLSGVDIFACLTFGDAPSILTPSELMWYEQQSDCTSSIDGVFGVSQAMLLATAEVCQLAHDFVSQGPTPDLQATAASVFVGLDEHWLAKIIATPDSLRIQIGDLMFRHYLIAFLLVKVFGHDGRVHPRIQQSIAAIKELLVEAACLTGRLTGVIMPLLFASSYSDTASRETFLNLIDLTKHILGCWDVDATERIVREVWKRRDANQENWTYEDVIRDEPSLRILLV